MPAMDAPDPAAADRLIATPADAGMRLDAFVALRLPAISRSRAQRLIRDGYVRIDGRTAKSSTLIDAGAHVDVTVPPVAAAEPEAEPLPLSIVFDDDDLVVIDKPAGMVVHPGAGHASGTLVNALLHHVRGLSGIGGVERPGIVHRLDRGTSGLMVIAKHDRAHRDLALQFQRRTVTKEYVALVWGGPQAGLEMTQPIGRDPRHRQRMSTTARYARAAVTTVLTTSRYGEVTLVRLVIGTGRTHQIRVHLSSNGFPIVGDPLYGGVRKHVPAALGAVTRLARPFLHAARLTFTQPSTGEPLMFESPLAPDLQGVLDTLERAAGREASFDRDEHRGTRDKASD
jgi:23S rRNA pseudouridine1911/1915/1917 synthase